MPNLAYLLSPRVTDAGTISGSATISDGDITNLQNPRPRSRAVFTLPFGFVEWDLGALYPINTFCVGYINSVSSTDVIAWHAAATYPATSSPLIMSGLLNIWNPGSDLSAYAETHRQYEHPTTHNVRYIRLDFQCSQFVQMSRAFAGVRIQPEHTVSAIEFEASEPIASVLDLGGEETRRPMGGSRRGVKMEWPALTKVEALGKVYELMMERGSARDYLAAIEPGGVETINPIAYLYLGYGALKVRYNTFSHIWSANLDMVEAAPLRMR